MANTDEKTQKTEKTYHFENFGYRIMAMGFAGFVLGIATYFYAESSANYVPDGLLKANIVIGILAGLFIGGLSPQLGQRLARILGIAGCGAVLGGILCTVNIFICNLLVSPSLFGVIIFSLVIGGVIFLIAAMLFDYCEELGQKAERLASGDCVAETALVDSSVSAVPVPVKPIVPASVQERVRKVGDTALPGNPVSGLLGPETPRTPLTAEERVRKFENLVIYSGMIGAACWAVVCGAGINPNIRFLVLILCVDLCFARFMSMVAIKTVKKLEGRTMAQVVAVVSVFSVTGMILGVYNGLFMSWVVPPYDIPSLPSGESGLGLILAAAVGSISAFLLSLFLLFSAFNNGILPYKSGLSASARTGNPEQV